MGSEINKIVIIGSGNVATHLVKAFKGKGFDVENLSSRLDRFNIADASLVIISVLDDAVGEVAHKVAGSLPDTEGPIVVHTSGSVSLEALKDSLRDNTPCGVFYPMQTFSRDVAMRYDNIPFLIEASDASSLEQLKMLARAVSTNVSEANSATRKNYHIGAVFACNFVNHLWALADKYLSDNNLSFELLHPLLEQTFSKIAATEPFNAQTGPAVRGDKKVIDSHLNQLKDYPELINIYTLLTQSIESLHNTSQK